MRDVTDATFDQEVLQADRPVVVDFWAPWCGPCHAITPVLESLESEAGDHAVFAKLNVDQNPVAASRYGVLSRAHYARALREMLPPAELDGNAVAE